MLKRVKVHELGTSSMERATNVAAVVGQVFASLFILAGLWQFFSGHGFGGLWIAFIGWFLLDAARSSRMQVEIMHAFSGVRVRDLWSAIAPGSTPHITPIPRR